VHHDEREGRQNKFLYLLNKEVNLSQKKKMFIDAEHLTTHFIVTKISAKSWRESNNY